MPLPTPDLDAVILEGEQPVRDGDDEFTPGTQDAGALTSGGLDVRDMLKRFNGYDRVKIGVGKAHLRCGHIVDGEPLVSRYAFLKCPQVPILDVDSMHLGVMLGELPCESSVPAANVEQPTSAKLTDAPK